MAGYRGDVCVKTQAYKLPRLSYVKCDQNVEDMGYPNFSLVLDYLFCDVCLYKLGSYILDSVTLIILQVRPGLARLWDEIREVWRKKPQGKKCP